MSPVAIANQLPFACTPREKHPIWLAAETALVTIAAIAAVTFLNVQHSPDFRWFLIPSVLVSAALIPTWLRKDEFAHIGLDRDHATVALDTVCRTCVYVFPTIFLALWLMTSLRLPIPLKPVVAGPQNWLTWLVYQFLYVAVAEEVFFRGYVQNNVMRLMRGIHWIPIHTQQFIGMLASAGCFAVAHYVVQGQSLALLTFLPGLVLAWLFVRTNSLLAPILFHGLANVSYSIMALTLA
jgi:membrane protease YdiL (CAAX protease family)